MKVLGIESSCDETAVAIYDATQGLVAHALHSQIAIHKQYGGVVPELASRDHVKHLIPLVHSALSEAKLSLSEIDAIGYTKGPGLIGALLAGASFAKSLAFALNIPCYGVHHLEAHLLAAQLENPALQFPFLVLLVSGGHSQFIEARALGEYSLLGDTLDDAVGEAFDKVAKMMGLPYPGGAALAALADNCPKDAQNTLTPFPRPMLDRPGLDLSFSGLKTHALMAWNKSTKDDVARSCIAYAFQEAIVHTLLAKCQRAVQSTHLRQLVIAGGVGANHTLRQTLSTWIHQEQGEIYFPRPEFCTDNGAMVAYTAYLHFMQKKQDPNYAIEVQARWPLS